MTTPPKAPAPWESAYSLWQGEPTPERLSAVVDSLSPVVDYSLLGDQDPAMRMQAKYLTARAVKKYKSTGGAALPTWVSGQLRQLTRYRREQRSPVKIGDRTQLEGWYVEQARQKFMDEHGREPDVVELADAAQLSPRKIGNVRKKMISVPSEGAFGGNLPTSETDHAAEALDYVLQDSDHVDRMILQHKTGHGGTPILSNIDLAAKLKLHPSQVTRRAQKLSFRINEIQDALGGN